MRIPPLLQPYRRGQAIRLPHRRMCGVHRACTDARVRAFDAERSLARFGGLAFLLLLKSWRLRFDLLWCLGRLSRR
jgi:hypothetical protein